MFGWLREEGGGSTWFLALWLRKLGKWWLIHWMKEHKQRSKSELAWQIILVWKILKYLEHFEVVLMGKYLNIPAWLAREWFWAEGIVVTLENCVEWEKNSVSVKATLQICLYLSGKKISEEKGIFYWHTSFYLYFLLCFTDFTFFTNWRWATMKILKINY